MRFIIGGGKEFGEVYHVACAYVLLESVTLKFENFAIGQQFFDKVLAGQPRHPEPNDDAHPGKTADIIFDRYFPGCMAPIKDQIQRIGELESWRCPPSFRPLLDGRTKVLIWNRRKQYRPDRNSPDCLIRQLAELCRKNGTTPLLIGGTVPNSGCVELGEFWNDEFFADNSIAKQLWCIDCLFQHGALANLGVMSGAMDGPAMFFGNKTVFIARRCDAEPRMCKVARAVPNLVWQPFEYEGTLSTLTPDALSEIENKIWQNRRVAAR